MDEIDSKKAILYNLDTGRVLFEKDPESETTIASLTKIMTSILAIENQDLDNVVKITTPMVSNLEEFVVAGIQVGQEMTVEELLYLTLLPSAGDAAQALAIHNSGSIESFADLMNQKANEIGLKNTHFSNPAGKDEDNYSSAKDIATLLKYALKNPEFKKIFETFEYYSPTLEKTFLKTTGKIETLSGAKTGFTYDAGRCLASTASLNGVNYLLVNLNANYLTNNHIYDALAIYNYYSENYGYKTIKSNGEKLLDLEVKDSETKNLEILSKEEIKGYFKNDFDISSLNYDYDGVEAITNKNKVGDFLGNYRISDEEGLIYETPIYLEQEIEFYPYWLWNTGVGIGILIMATCLIRAIRRRRK